jgi:choline dehydrogenase
VLATRLSTNPARQVLLLEAGPAYHASEFPDVLANANRVGGDAEHDWGYKSSDQDGLGHPVTSAAAYAAAELGASASFEGKKWTLPRRSGPARGRA